MTLKIYGVIIPPLQCGTAFGHSMDGTCVRFSGNTDRMTDLCDRVTLHRLNNLGPVEVESSDWTDVTVLDRSSCPVHADPSSSSPEAA
jgi:hypothetical protein